MSESLITSSYLAVITIGLVHGLEPGHGWPIAAILSKENKRPYSYGLVAGGVLSAAHFVSSLAVVAVYYLANYFLGSFVDFSGPWFKILTAGLLLILAFRFFRQKRPHLHGSHGEHIMSKNDEVSHEDAHKYGLDHDHSTQSPQIMNLRQLTGFAFVLGFAHEEEFVLLALFIGGVDPLLAMSVYATAVTVTLVAATLVAIKAFLAIETRMNKYQKYIPKITGLILTILAVLFLLPVFGGPTIY